MTETATWSTSTVSDDTVPYRYAGGSGKTAIRRHCNSKRWANRYPPAPGEFMMMYAFGIGEVAISVSGVPTGTDNTITHTIRAVGAVSRALHDAQAGNVIGMRGPFGTNWGLAEAAGRDLVIVAGGVGLAPLRPVVLGAFADRDRSAG